MEIIFRLITCLKNRGAKLGIAKMPYSAAAQAAKYIIPRHCSIGG